MSAPRRRFRDSNEYELGFSNDESPQQLNAPPDDRMGEKGEFEVNEELAFNLDVE